MSDNEACLSKGLTRAPSNKGKLDSKQRGCDVAALKEVSTHGYQAPRVLHRDTVDLLLKLGATPLEKSGVVAYVQRATD